MDLLLAEGSVDVPEQPAETRGLRSSSCRGMSAGEQAGLLLQARALEHLQLDVPPRDRPARDLEVRQHPGPEPARILGELPEHLRERRNY